MEIATFSACQQCGGNGKINGQKCPLCFGYRSYFFDNNNFLYWEKTVSYSHIFIREFKKVINIVINTVLVVASVLTMIVLFLILNKVQFEPRNFWYFLSQANKENFWLWILILMDMFLYYRLAYGGQKTKQLSRDLKSVNTYVKHNIADSLGQEVSAILDKSWLYGQHKKVFPVTAWHLLFALLNDKDIRLVLARLGVGADNIKEQIDNNLANLVGQFENQEELTEAVKNALLNAYFHMHKRHADHIAEVDLLYGLVMSNQQIKNLFYDFDIDEEKIDNVIAWVDINKQLLKRYQTFRSRSFFKPKSGINRSYTAIATPVLNNFSSDLTMMARSGYLPLSVAREKEIYEIINTIESSFSSVVLVGPPGVGKTNIIEGIANRMMAEDIPELFQDKRLVSVSVPLIISGASGGGGVEERFLAILHESAASGNIILYFEDIHQLVGVASQGNEGVDLSEVLAAEIRNKNIIVIASTSNKEYVQYIENSALGQALKKINIS
ncbi:MAG: AAA family ATPase, partial [bacterium]|nr:AAA family ATPase [bacterium]